MCAMQRQAGLVGFSAAADAHSQVAYADLLHCRILRCRNAESQTDVVLNLFSLLMCTTYAGFNETAHA